MSAFDQAFSTIAGIECESSYLAKQIYPLVPTKYGIAEGVAREWGYKGEMRDLPIGIARAIAKAWYWERYQCDQFDPRIAFQIFDAAYNGGYPVEWLQECVGATPDGQMRAKTIAAVRAADVWKTIALFNAKHLNYLTNQPNWDQNARGWSRRIAQNILNGE